MIQRLSANLIHPRRSFLPLALLLKLGISLYGLGFELPQRQKIFADHHINLTDRCCNPVVGACGYKAKLDAILGDFYNVFVLALSLTARSVDLFGHQQESLLSEIDALPLQPASMS